jgi:hypothetical protein
MEHRPRFSFWICLEFLVLICFLCMPRAAVAGEVIVVGGTEAQRRFVSCVAEVAASELRGIPNADEPMTFVILEHRNFLQARDAFHAHGARLAFSTLTSNRVYLSSRVFVDLGTAMWCIPHELGHFATQSIFEDHAELAAERIRWRTRQMCGSAVQ